MSICEIQNLCDTMACPGPILHILNLIETSAVYVRQIGFSTDCFWAIKLNCNYAFILHKSNILFIYIKCMSMHVT